MAGFATIGTTASTLGSAAISRNALSSIGRGSPRGGLSLSSAPGSGSAGAT